MGPGKLKRGSLSAITALLLSTAAFAQDTGSTDPTTDHVVVQNWHDLNPNGGEAIAVGEPDPTGSGNATDEPTDDTATDDVPAGDDDGTVAGEPDPNGDGTGDDASGDDDPAVDPEIVDALGDLASSDDAQGTVVHDMDGGPCTDCDMAGTAIAEAPLAKPMPLERSQTGKRHSAATALATTPMTQCLSAHPRAAWICEWQNGAGN